MSIALIENLNIINMTPHPIKIMDPRVTHESRNGMVFMDDDVSEVEGTLEVIPTSGISLNVQEDKTIPDTIGHLRLYSQMGNARFDQTIPKNILDNTDVILVSNRCARLLLRMCNSIISGTNQNPELSLFEIDKFYVPTMVVYRNIEYGRNFPIGAIGIQKVTPSLTVEAYGSKLKLNKKADIPKPIPISAASAYKSYIAAVNAGIQRNKYFEELEEYLFERNIL